MDVLLYGLDFALLLSCGVDIWCRTPEKRFSLGIIRTCLLLPMLAAAYLGLYMQKEAGLVAPLFFTENTLAFIWLLLAHNWLPLMEPEAKRRISYRIAPFLAVLLGLFAGALWTQTTPMFRVGGGALAFPNSGYLFFSSFFVLVAVLIMAWRLEVFWRFLNRHSRRQYKLLVIAFFLIIGSLLWSTSMRITYLQINQDHLLLLSLLMALAWLMAAYAVAANRLLNRQIFVSRKIVYSTIAPLVFALYLIAVGLISILIRSFGWSLHFALQWLLIVSGLLLIASFALSSRLRDRVRYFVSTHFYVNKYEYRDEWLNFSELLHSRLNEKGIVEALWYILNDSMYTDTIKIWVGDMNRGFYLAAPAGSRTSYPEAAISAEDPLVSYLQSVSYLDCQEPGGDAEKKRILYEKGGFLDSLGIVLLAPLAIGGHFVGIIGLGPEYTGGSYGNDDFDLLAAISSQAASVLLAVQTAEELAKTREQSAWNTLSTFVLHDIKNAATMLSLVQKNASQHIQNPEFQQDMLASIDDALKRMNKVQARLNTLKGDIKPSIAAVEACEMIESACSRIGRKLPGVAIEIDCSASQTIWTDPDCIAIILENLILNAIEAGRAESSIMRVCIRLLATDEGGFLLECTDNGPGITYDLLPDKLFEPFITGKPEGSGIGLWQVRRLAESMGGKIRARNSDTGGACFSILFDGKTGEASVSRKVEAS
jgi:putative PEP-CTERM system histidine kinase